MAYYVARLVSWLCCLLPAGICDSVGELLGKLTWPLVPRRRRRMAADNVQRCLKVTEEEAARIARASWVRFGPMVIEIMRFPILKPRFSEMVEFEGLHYYFEGLALGRGGILASGHCGNWELMGGALAAKGLPISGVVMRQREKGFDRFINEYRRLVGIHVTYKSNVREMFKLLEEGWVVGLLMDQDGGRRDSIIFDWFDRPTAFVQGPAVLARFRNAPIFPTYIRRLPDGRHHVTVHPPIFVPRTKDKAADIRQTMEELSRILEQHIREEPETWFWLHDRWKSLRD